MSVEINLLMQHRDNAKGSCLILPNWGLGKSLLNNLTRNNACFLIKSDKKCSHVLDDIVVAKERLLEDYMLVGTFLGKKPTPSMFATWLAILNARLGNETIVASNNVSHIIFYLK